MKKNQVRKSTILIIILTIMLTMSVFAAAPIIIGGSSAESGDIVKGDIFMYNLTVNSAASAAGLKATVSGGFSLASGSSFDIADNMNQTYQIPIVYNGTSQKLTILVSNGTDTAIHTATLTNALVESSGSGNTTNPNKNFPKFSLDFGTSTPKFIAGDKIEFNFKVENTVSYPAHDVEIRFLTDADSPFVDTNNGLISNKIYLQGYTAEILKMPVETKAGAKSGFYTVAIEITSKNVSGTAVTEKRNIQVEVVNKNKLPSVVISNIKIKNEILTPGQDDVILLELKNLGTIDIKNMDVELEGTKLNEITLTSDTTNKQIRTIKASGTDFVTYNINVSDKLKVDKTELTLKLKYYDKNGGEYTQSIPVYLDISGGAGNIYDHGFEVTSQPKAVVPGQEFTIKYNFTNNSDVVQKNLKLTLSSDGSFIFKSQPITIIKEISAGETKALSYTLIADKNMESNNYPTYITIESLTDSTVSRKEYLGIYVDGDSSKNSKPKIIVENYNYGKDVILAGETFELEMTFFNTSNSMGIQNAKVSISSDDGAFVPVNASSSFYIEKVPAKERVTHTMTFKAKADLNVKTYNIIAEIEYEDSNGNSYDISKNPYKATEKMGVPVMQELRLEVEDITIPEMAPVYQGIELYVEFFNMGKSPLQNMMVTTTGEFEIQDGKYFVGNFNAGSNEYYSATIIPMTVGPQEGTITFDFEDAVGEKHSVEKTFSFETFEMEQPDEMFPPEGYDGDGEFPMGEEEKSFPWIPVVVVIVIIGIVVLVVVKRKMRIKKEMALDE